ncbi:hypothetical protein D3C84_1003000 [compost metagenome]
MSLGKNRAHFRQGGLHSYAERCVGELLHQQAAGHQHAGFLLGEVHRWQVITLHQAVADAGLCRDRHAGFAQRGEVSINGADTQAKMLGKLLRRYHSPGVEKQDQRQEAIHSIHA